MFKIRKGVFVPQYDTEGIFEIMNPHLINGLEIGPGTGVISVTLAKHFMRKMTSIEINKKAVKITKKNAKRLGADITVLHQDLFEYKPNQKLTLLFQTHLTL